MLVWLDHFDPLESIVSHVVADETGAGDGGRPHIFVIAEAVNGGVGVLRFGRRRRRDHHQRRLVVVRIAAAVVIARSANRLIPVINKNRGGLLELGVTHLPHGGGR